MAHSVSAMAVPSHRLNLEDVHPTMAKADLKNLEKPWRQQIGRAVLRAFALAGVSQKEAAGLINRDQAQIARWIAGSERPQMDAIFEVDSLRQPLVIALAELAGTGVRVKTTIELEQRVSA